MATFVVDRLKSCGIIRTDAKSKTIALRAKLRDRSTPRYLTPKTLLLEMFQYGIFG
jgi:hypothetical protein